MKRLLFRFSVLIAVISVPFFGDSALNAQGSGSPFQYGVEYASLPQGTTSIYINEFAEVNNGSTTSVFVVGRYTLNGVRRGFVYDQKNDNFIDVASLLGIENTWSGSSCFDINSNGIVVGVVKDSTNHGMWFDLFDLNPTPTMILIKDQFPDLIGSDYGYHASRINNFGDVLLHYGLEDGGINGGGVVNIDTSTIYPALDSGAIPYAINDFGCVVGITGTKSIFRYYLDDPESLEEFPELIKKASSRMDVNMQGEFCASASIEYRRNRRMNLAFRFGNQLDWFSDPDEGVAPDAGSLNASGDVACSGWDVRDSFFYHSELEQSFQTSDLVDDPFIGSARLSHVYLTERVPLSQPAPIILGQAFGANGEIRMFFLTPHEPIPPSGDSETYSVLDDPNWQPIAIRDKNSVGISSSILADDHVISNLTVTLNITHQRPSDLKVTLYGPGNPDGIPLPILSGDNNVADFNGTNSRGLWTIEVIDTRKRKTGTLNSWSMTVDY